MGEAGVLAGVPARHTRTVGAPSGARTQRCQGGIPSHLGPNRLERVVRGCRGSGEYGTIWGKREDDDGAAGRGWREYTSGMAGEHTRG